VVLDELCDGETISGSAGRDIDVLAHDPVLLACFEK